MNAKHTPGPWHVTQDIRPGKLSIESHQDGYIAAIERREDEEANARLIAIAPTLRDALEKAAFRLEDAANYIAEEVSEPAAQQWDAAVSEIRALLARIDGDAQ